jgi:hypothetical protein
MHGLCDSLLSQQFPSLLLQNLDRHLDLEKAKGTQPVHTASTTPHMFHPRGL